MSFVHGKDAYFSVDSNDLSTYLNSVEFSQAVDMAESSTMGNEAKTYLSGLSDATISIAGFFDSTATTGPDAVLSGLVGGETAVTFEYGPEGNTTGKVKYSGSCFLTSYQLSAPVADVVAFSAEFQATGAITRGTFA